MFQKTLTLCAALVLSSSMALAQFPYLEHFDGPLDTSRWIGRTGGTGRQHETIRYPIGGQLYLGMHTTQGGDAWQQVRLNNAQHTRLLAAAVTTVLVDVVPCEDSPSTAHTGLTMNLFHIDPFSYGLGVFVEAADTAGPYQVTGVVWRDSPDLIEVLHEVPLGTVNFGEMTVLAAHWEPGVQITFYFGFDLQTQVLPFTDTGTNTGIRALEVVTRSAVCPEGKAEMLVAIDAAYAE